MSNPKLNKKEKLCCEAITCLNCEFVSRKYGYCKIVSPRIKVFEDDKWGCMDEQHSLENNVRITKILYGCE